MTDVIGTATVGEARGEARRYMEMIEKVRANDGNVGERVMSPYAYILQHGKQYTNQTAPDVKGWRGRNPLKQCHVNAYNLAMSDLNLTYVEGVATGVTPVDHAWCVKVDGTVVDPTWGGGRQKCDDYFGVSFDLRTLHDVMALTTVYGAMTAWWKWEEVLKILERKGK